MILNLIGYQVLKDCLRKYINLKMKLFLYANIRQKTLRKYEEKPGQHRDSLLVGLEYQRKQYRLGRAEEISLTGHQQDSLHYLKIMSLI